MGNIRRDWNKMSATIKHMEYQFVDKLNADQLEPEDLIEIDDEIVEVVYVDSLANGYVITFKNEFGEKDVIEFDGEQQFNWYILRDEDVD
jgi:hypothetical protein